MLPYITGAKTRGVYNSISVLQSNEAGGPPWQGSASLQVHSCIRAPENDKLIKLQLLGKCMTPGSMLQRNEAQGPARHGMPSFGTHKAGWFKVECLFIGEARFQLDSCIRALVMASWKGCKYRGSVRRQGPSCYAMELQCFLGRSGSISGLLLAGALP